MTTIGILYNTKHEQNKIESEKLRKSRTDTVFVCTDKYK